MKDAIVSSSRNDQSNIGAANSRTTPRFELQIGIILRLRNAIVTKLVPCKLARVCVKRNVKIFSEGFIFLNRMCKSKC